MRKSLKIASAVLLAALLLMSLTACKEDTPSSQSGVWQPVSGATYNKDDPMPMSSASSASSASGQMPESEPAASQSSSEEPASSSIPPQPAPEFVDGTPKVTASGRNVTVEFKTNVESTINAILATSGEKIGTGTFYDYFNRGQAYAAAAGKQSTYMVTEAGKTETYTLPDVTQSYYLLINAVENLTGTWQNYITVIPLFDPAAGAPLVAAGPTQEADNGTNAVVTLQANVASKVYALLTPSGAASPTAQQVREGGSGYGGTMHGSFVVDTAAAAPYATRIEIPKGSLAAGKYTVWLVMQGTAKADGPLSSVVSLTLEIK